MIVISDVKGLVSPEILAGAQSGIDEVLRSIMKAAASEWRRQAKNLRTTRAVYINSIQQPVVKNGVGSVTLVGRLAHIVEDGLPAMDMHDTLLGPNVPVAPPGQKGKRRAADGHYYRSIPFRHQTPGSVGVGGTPMDLPYRQHEAVADSRKLANEVYGGAQQLSPTLTVPGSGAMRYADPTAGGALEQGWGGRLEAGLAPILRAEPKTIVINGKTRTAEAHAVDIFAGMVRMEKFYAVKQQGSYMTFRTISEAKPDKWLRPAVPGRHYAKDVHDFVQRLAPAAFEAFLESL